MLCFKKFNRKKLRMVFSFLWSTMLKMKICRNIEFLGNNNPSMPGVH